MKKKHIPSFRDGSQAPFVAVSSTTVVVRAGELKNKLGHRERPAIMVRVDFRDKRHPQEGIVGYII